MAEMFISDKGEEQSTFVKTEKDILENINILYKYLSDSEENKKGFAKELIKNGKVFVIINIEGQEFFFPSRFIGYKDNSMEKHEQLKVQKIADGKLTTPIISQILKNTPYHKKKLDERYKLFCERIGITPNSNRRKFWQIKNFEEIALHEVNKIKKFFVLNPQIKTGEKEQIVKVRFGQGKVRKKLLEQKKYCELCNIEQEQLLIASHIKPWAKCKDKEKGDMDNLLLLCVMHDALFDKGFISFDDEGKILVSESLDDNVKQTYGIDGTEKIVVTENMKKYLAEHRKLFSKRRLK